MNQLLIELAAALFGVVGTLLLAFNGRNAGWGFVAYLVSNAGWIAFAWIHGHWGMLVQQLFFTASSLIGIWVWLLKPALRWDEWRGDFSGNVTMRIQSLVRVHGRKVDLHQIVAADAPGCYHTHPAHAIRFVLWNGYIEELEDGTTREWRPGMVGWVRPSLSHRIAALRRAKPSYSLWLRGRKSAQIELRGEGWRK